MNIRNKKHGKSYTSEYATWICMKDRCKNKNNKQYKDYGGRGIDVCEEWKNSFTNFLKDMGTRPKSMTLERVNNNGNYEKDNCKWASRSAQSANQRTLIKKKNREPRGVFMRGCGKKFRVIMTIDYKQYSLGTYSSEAEASKVYTETFKEWYGKCPA